MWPRTKVGKPENAMSKINFLMHFKVCGDPGTSTSSQVYCFTEPGIIMMSGELGRAVLTHAWAITAL